MQKDHIITPTNIKYFISFILSNIILKLMNHNISDVG